MDTRSIVAHNINERMQRNQHGGCAMMAMGRFSAEVVETGVDFSGLGRWCWMRVGSGDKITRIVMAYQPSGSSSSHSAGTTVREQHERYFEARGDLRSAKAIFFEQLIAQLVVWKATDADIILLGDFNENVYSGRIAKRLEQSDLNFSEQCLGCTGTHIPPTFRDGIMTIDEKDVEYIRCEHVNKTGYILQLEAQIQELEKIQDKHQNNDKLDELKEKLAKIKDSRKFILEPEKFSLEVNLKLFRTSFKKPASADQASLWFL